MSDYSRVTPECRLFRLIPFTKPEIIEGKIRKKEGSPWFKDLMYFSYNPFSVRFMHVTKDVPCKNRIKNVILKRGTAGICNYNVSLKGIPNYCPAQCDRLGSKIDCSHIPPALIH